MNSSTPLNKATKDFVKELENVYHRLVGLADNLKRGGGNYHAVEELLNWTRASEEGRQLAFIMSLMRDRDSLVTYLFKSRQAHLLLLIDGRTVAVALGLSNTHKIYITRNAGGYRVVPSDSREVGYKQNCKPVMSGEMCLHVLAQLSNANSPCRAEITAQDYSNPKQDIPHAGMGVSAPAQMQSPAQIQSGSPPPRTIKKKNPIQQICWADMVEDA